jgi:hypothetical protein
MASRISARIRAARSSPPKAAQFECTEVPASLPLSQPPRTNPLGVARIQVAFVREGRIRVGDLQEVFVPVDLELGFHAVST